MARLKDITSIWTNIKEIDLKPYREAALHPVKIALVGQSGSGRHTLAELLRRDPAQPLAQTQSPLAILPLESADLASGADLIILLVNLNQADVSYEQELSKRWNDSGRNLLVLGTHWDQLVQSGASTQWPLWSAERVLYGSLMDPQFIQRNLGMTVLEMLPDLHLPLGRQFPLFRQPVAQQMISDTCFSNTAYALSTGLAEIIPVLDLPLNVTDMILLTKSQAFLAYKIGLVLGFSTRWQDYLAEFGSVIGGGFLWRQLARSLVGLIPIWGIVPKVAVSYAGTYVVGKAVLQWYLTGRQLSPKQMRNLYLQAFGSGKEFARRLLRKNSRPRLGEGKRAELTAISENAILSAEVETVAEADTHPISPPSPVSTSNKVQPEPEINNTKRRRLFYGKKDKTAKQRICPACKKVSSGDAAYCQYCGHKFDEEVNSD